MQEEWDTWCQGAMTEEEEEEEEEEEAVRP